MAKADIHEKTKEESLEIASSGLGWGQLDVLEIKLSERNLISLLAKLHIDGSKRTIYNSDVPDGYVLKLVAEHDDAHYDGGEYPLEEIHSDTEKLAGVIKKALDKYQGETKVVELFHKSVVDSRGDSA